MKQASYAACALTAWCARAMAGGGPGNETQATTHHRNVIVDELDGGAQLYESEVNESVMSMRVENV